VFDIVSVSSVEHETGRKNKSVTKQKQKSLLSADNKLPNPKTLQSELSKLNTELNNLYGAQKNMKNELEQIQLMKQNIDMWLKPDTFRSRENIRGVR